jgi:hypothetical protein
VVPPDLAIAVASVDVTLRQPLEDGARKNVAIASLRDLTTNITISHSANTPTTPDAATIAQVKSLGGFLSLTGSLIQMRLSIQVS